MEKQKDTKQNYISIEDFFQKHDYLYNAHLSIWQNQAPEIDKKYFKFTSDKLICVKYGSQKTNFGEDITEKLEYIDVAVRDGVKEYAIFDIEIEEQKNSAQRKTTQNAKELQRTKQRMEKLFPPFVKEKETPIIKKFEDFIVNTNYKCEEYAYDKNYLVLDLETNGLRYAKDDLLSLSIYDPKSGKAYNRFFPLDLQPLVLRTYINGITEEDLEDATHITQNEYDELVEKFDLKNSVILTYSGGKGGFDRNFLNHYLARQNIIGFESLQFDNIKNYLPVASIDIKGKVTKDNMCELFGIDGVTKVHTSINDCVLQWKLFEKVHNRKMLFIKNELYEFNEDYVVPISYLNRYADLAKFAGIQIPNLDCNKEIIYRYDFPASVMKKIKKFKNIITGTIFEKIINQLLQAEKQLEDEEFSINNKKKLKLIGSLEESIELIDNSKFNGVYLIPTLSLKNTETGEINAVTNIILKNIEPVIKFIKENIFLKNIVKSQELVFSKDGKLYALCDLSDSNNVIEIKTQEQVFLGDGSVKPEILRQLYYQANGRNTYLMLLAFNGDASAACVVIYKINIFESSIFQDKLLINEKRVLSEIIKNNKITFNEIAQNLGDLSRRSVEKIVSVLKDKNYIKREGTTRTGIWVILKEENN